MKAKMILAGVGLVFAPTAGLVAFDVLIGEEKRISLVDALVRGGLARIARPPP
jgi:ABC-type spermidine/putrescine transport system permease subunit I